MLTNIDTIESLEVYKLLANIVVPRPIAWISTKSAKGVLNIAPFSYFTPLSSSPATVIVSIGHKEDGSAKDTLKNLRENKKCSIVIAAPNDVKDVEISAKPLDYNESEFDKFNIETKEILTDYPKVPKSANIVLFGDYLKEVELEGSKTIPVILEIKSIYVDDMLYKDGKVKIDPLARVGAGYFALGKELKKS